MLGRCSTQHVEGYGVGLTGGSSYVTSYDSAFLRIWLGAPGCYLPSYFLPKQQRFLTWRLQVKAVKCLTWFIIFSEFRTNYGPWLDDKGVETTSVCGQIKVKILRRRLQILTYGWKKKKSSSVSELPWLHHCLHCCSAFLSMKNITILTTYSQSVKAHFQTIFKQNTEHNLLQTRSCVQSKLP